MFCLQIFPEKILNFCVYFNTESSKAGKFHLRLTMTSLKLSVDDPEFVEKIIFEVKSQGHFDTFRKECLADVDTQPAFQNLHTR